MKMAMRWFGPVHDPVTLDKLRQVPGLKGVITTLYSVPPGEAWSKDEFLALKREVEESGLSIIGIESLGVHDSIKVAAKDRDKYIENYIASLKVLGEAGIDLVCYNFMAVFDWTRTNLAKPRSDGATAMSYEQEIIDKIDPYNMSALMNAKANGHILPGWEPERMARIRELFDMYRGIDSNTLLVNTKYFLDAIMPVCEKYGIKMAMHPDDPAWPVFGLPRIMSNKEQMLRIVKMTDNPLNGITLCTGSLGSNPDNDILEIIRALKGRIHFAHVRNVRHNGPFNFEESAHLSTDGSLDMYAIMKTLFDAGFDGPIRPDHGRNIWDEVSMPGYGLYDRALGVSYLNGLLEAIEKNAKNQKANS